jgi:dihydrofolate reductase
MRKIIVFNMISLDGYFEGPDRDITWHTVDGEFNEFAIRQLDEAGILLFGRVTYQLMASYWPTAAALKDDPLIAGKMNSLPKIVFSRTLEKVDWENTRVLKENIAEEVSNLKRQPGSDLVIFGSSDLIVSLLQMGLIDEIRLMVSPILLGRGKTIFFGLKDRLGLKLLKTRTFQNGNVLLFYQPVLEEESNQE